MKIEKTSDGGLVITVSKDDLESCWTNIKIPFPKPVTVNPLFGLRSRTKSFLSEYCETFANHWIERGNTLLTDLMHKHYIHDLSEILNRLEKNGFAQVVRLPGDNGKIIKFRITF